MVLCLIITVAVFGGKCEEVTEACRIKQDAASLDLK